MKKEEITPTKVINILRKMSYDDLQKIIENAKELMADKKGEKIAELEAKIKAQQEELDKIKGE